MNILVTGVSGYVGSRLAPALLREGHTVRGFSRRAQTGAPGVEMVQGDAVTGRGLEAALSDIDVAYFLIHAMEPSNDGSFAERERASAEQFAAAARAAGVPRVVYLGGLIPAQGPAS